MAIDIPTTTGAIVSVTMILILFARNIPVSAPEGLNYRWFYVQTLQWCHNGRGGVSDHQPHDCLLNRYRRSMNSPHKGPVKRKMFQFGDVIMENTY